MKFKKISVIGLGYIGLPTAAMFASKGIDVVGIDTSTDVVDTINRGQIHIVEPGLSKLVSDAVRCNKLRAVGKPEFSDAFLIAVPTPFKLNDLSTPEPDISFIHAACVSIAPIISKGNLIILESTSPVGTTEKICRWLSELRPDLSFPNENNSDVDVHVAHCPERVLPGNMIHELMTNDRIIGGITPKCSELAVKLYKLFVTGDCHVTNARTAEMAKLTENASRDVQIAFANELSIICDEQNIDCLELIRLANKHPRVNILNPGPGVGGHCIAVDPWFIISQNPDNSRLMKTARSVNLYKTKWVVDRIKKILEYRLERTERVTISFLGLSYKANIDDLRESPSVKIVSEISQIFDTQVLVVEPNIKHLPDIFRENVQLTDLWNAISETDLIVVLVGHTEFQGLKDHNLIEKEFLDFSGAL